MYSCTVHTVPRLVEKVVTRICQNFNGYSATILHSRRSTPSPSRNHEESIAKARRFVPKSTPKNEPLSSYASATKKKKKMEKIEGLANFSLTC